MALVRAPSIEWVDWFNNRRLLESIGSVPPAAAEAADYAIREVRTTIAA